MTIDFFSVYIYVILIYCQTFFLAEVVYFLFSLLFAFWNIFQIVLHHLLLCFLLYCVLAIYYIYCLEVCLLVKCVLPFLGFVALAKQNCLPFQNAFLLLLVNDFFLAFKLSCCCGCAYAVCGWVLISSFPIKSSFYSRITSLFTPAWQKRTRKTKKLWH